MFLCPDLLSNPRFLEEVGDFKHKVAHLQVMLDTKIFNLCQDLVKFLKFSHILTNISHLIWRILE